MVPIRAALLILTLGLSACASPGGDAGPFRGEPAAGAEEIRIEIQNLNFADATVWARVQGGNRTRLGTVRGKSDSVFTMPWRFPLPLRLQVDLVGGGRCTTEDLMVDPGDSLLMQIQPVLANSDFCR
jgi:hypothetical protein